MIWKRASYSVFPKVNIAQLVWVYYVQPLSWLFFEFFKHSVTLLICQIILRNHHLPFIRSGKKSSLYISWPLLHCYLIAERQLALFPGKVTRPRRRGIVFFILFVSPKTFFFFNSETNVWNRILVSSFFPKIGEVWPMLTLFQAILRCTSCYKALFTTTVISKKILKL